MNNEQNYDQPNERTGMRLLKSYYTALAKLTFEDKGRMYQAIMEYGLFDTQPDFKDLPNQLMMEVIWDLIKPNMDSSIQFAEKSKENGKKGGRPSTKKVDTTSTMPLEANTASVLKDKPIVVAEPIKEKIVQPEPSNERIKTTEEMLEESPAYQQWLIDEGYKEKP